MININQIKGMKKLFILLLSLTFAINSNAQRTLFGNKNTKYTTENSRYQKGTVPELRGRIVFQDEIETNDQDKDQVYKKLANWANLRYMPNTSIGTWPSNVFFKNYEYAAVISADQKKHSLQCTGNEELVFHKSALSSDFATINYFLDLEISEDKISFKMSNISYIYNFSDTPEKLNAEDWISDKKAFNKKGKPIKKCAKFRNETIDLKDRLINEIKSCLEIKDTNKTKTPVL